MAESPPDGNLREMIVWLRDEVRRDVAKIEACVSANTTQINTNGRDIATLTEWRSGHKDAHTRQVVGIGAFSTIIAAIAGAISRWLP